MKKFVLVAALAGLVLAALPSPASAAVLWYNGDEVWGVAHSNEINTAVPYSVVYDDFIIPAGSGSWNISSVWSYNYSSYTGENRPATTQAHWEIRSDVSEGAAGTLVAGGNATATETYSSTSPIGEDSYKILVEGLNVTLGPGKYWLSVTPIGYGAEYAQFFLQGTANNNAIGVDPVNDGNAFWYTTSFGGKNFVSLNTADFSMGIGGDVADSAVPEPMTCLLFASGLLGSLGIKRRMS